MPMIAVFVYFGALITGIVLSFTTRQQRRRRYIRIATVTLSTPIWLVIVLFVVQWFTFSSKEPPTLADLQHAFASKRADLETILAMSDEDMNFSRIAPDFLYRAPNPRYP